MWVNLSPQPLSPNKFGRGASLVCWRGRAGGESPHAISEADFVRLFARHELALRNYARLILPDWSGVDDVLQDASITMWESRQRLRDESGFLPWGKVIVRHKCFNAIAKMRRDRLLCERAAGSGLC